jgi:hypothetical protein
MKIDWTMKTDAELLIEDVAEELSEKTLLMIMSDLDLDIIEQIEREIEYKL